MIGDRLKAVLDKKKVTQKDLAELTNITEATISRYIHNQRGEFACLIKICQALDISADYLLGLKEK